MISFQEIEKLAELARIKLTEKEKKELQNNMESVLDYFKKIQEFNTEGGAEFFTTSNSNEFRNDENVNKEGSSEILLKQAPEIKNGYLKVKKIL